MDYEEMRAAYKRALDIDNVDYLDFCNSCKVPVIPNSGDITELSVGSKSYKMWYCDECAELEYAI
jgi:hypothetical protein